MKKVLLLGDSIRQNYQEYVKQKLKNLAEVYYPNDNGRFCHFTLRYAHDWIRILSNNHYDFDIIQFNCGLWDVLRLSNESETFTNEEMYGELIVRIYKRLKYLCPNATIIFALTTKVKEPGFSNDYAVYMTRKNEDIIRFNAIAEEALKEEIDGILINDLYSLTDTFYDEDYSDNVHFDTETGIEKLGEAVASYIMQCL